MASLPNLLLVTFLTFCPDGHLGEVQQAVKPKDWEKIEADDERSSALLASPHFQDSIASRISDVSQHNLRDVPPVPEGGGPLSVGVRMELVKLQKLGGVDGTMDIVFDLFMCWTDPRLSKDGVNASSSGVDELPIRSSVVWTPDIVVLNQVKDFRGQFGRNALPLVLNAGSGANVLWTKRVNSKVRCNVDMTNFPFDTQVCRIVLGSWASSYRQLVLVAKDPPEVPIDITVVQTAEFALKRMTVSQQAIYVRDAAERFDELQYEIHLERYSHFYLLNFMLPLVAVTMLTVATMWMSAHGVRANSATRMLLLVVQVMNITASWRPPSADDIWLDRFQSHCLAVAMASVLQSLVMDYFQYSALKDASYVDLSVVETVLRTSICLTGVYTLVCDISAISTIKLIEDPSLSIWSFRGLVGVVLAMFVLLGVSSLVSLAWLLFPQSLWQLVCCEDCSKIVTCGYCRNYQDNVGSSWLDDEGGSQEDSRPRHFSKESKMSLTRE